MSTIETLIQLIHDQGTLGLSQGRRFIYIQNSKRGLWSFVDTDEPVPAIAITGYVIDMYRKADDVPKLHVVMRTREDEFVLCSGLETHFSRDVMAAIAQLTPEQAKRPLKIVPCLKEVKKATDDGSVKRPVYANVLLDDKTLYTSQLKQKFTTEELYQMALPKVREQPATEGKIQSVDWKNFCQCYGILPMALKSLAEELGLPMGKLDARQSATLYQHAYARFVASATN